MRRAEVVYPLLRGELVLREAGVLGSAARRWLWQAHIDFWANAAGGTTKNIGQSQQWRRREGRKTAR